MLANNTIFCKFAFITSSFNQSQFVYKNLASIIHQNYDKDYFRIIYVNDASTDDTQNIIKNFKETNRNIKFDIINNDTNMGPAYSRYIAYHKCNDNEICVFLDGDDWLVEPNTLNILSNIYKNNDIYATFGTIINGLDNYNKEKLLLRHIHNFYPHLRTAYAFLCKAVPESYLKFNNEEWFIFQTDIALFQSIVELCGYQYMYLKDKFMFYNNNNCINNIDRGYSQINNNKKQFLKRKEYYEYIKTLPVLKPIIQQNKKYNKKIHPKSTAISYVSMISTKPKQSNIKKIGKTSSSRFRR